MSLGGPGFSLFNWGLGGIWNLLTLDSSFSLFGGGRASPLGLGGGGLLSWGGPDLGMSWASFRAGGGLSSVGLDGSVFFGGGGLLGTMEGGL